MSKMEIQWQTKICDSLKRQGGHGRKWLSEWQAGMPDLILSHPDLSGLVLMEVKLIKGVNPGFNRKLDITPKQVQELLSYHRAGAKVCLGVVVYLRPTEVYLCVLDHTADRLVDGTVPRFRWVKSEGGFNVVGAIGSLFGSNLHVKW